MAAIVDRDDHPACLLQEIDPARRAPVDKAVRRKTMDQQDRVALAGNLIGDLHPIRCEAPHTRLPRQLYRRRHDMLSAQQSEQTNEGMSNGAIARTPKFHNDMGVLGD